MPTVLRIGGYQFFFFSNTSVSCWSHGMSISATKLEPVASDVGFTRGKLHVFLSDGRELSVLLRWFPRLQSASAAQRKCWELIGGGIGIHWPLIDKDISVENLLAPPRPAGRK